MVYEFTPPGKKKGNRSSRKSSGRSSNKSGNKKDSTRRTKAKPGKKSRKQSSDGNNSITPKVLSDQLTGESDSPDRESPSTQSDVTQRMKRQGIFFGIITSIMTIIPFQIGIVGTGEANVREIMTSIISMSIADSMADAYGILFSDQASDSDVKTSDAMLAAGITLVTKIVCQLSFAIPFYYLDNLTVPTIINCTWGLVLLAFATYRVAKIRGISTAKYTIQTSLFTGAIIAGSYFFTKFMASQKK